MSDCIGTGCKAASLMARIAALEAERADLIKINNGWAMDAAKLEEERDALRQKLPEILGVLAGAASLCWTPKPTGEFDSTLASYFVDRALKECDAAIDAARSKP